MSDNGTMRREDLCERFYCAIKQEVLGATRYVSFPMRCKSWDCPTCRKVKAKDYKSRMQAINDGRPLYFLTLTYYHNQSPLEAWRTYNAAWNRFRTHVSKKFGSFDYIRVLESHKNTPYPHLHVILDTYIPATDLGRMAVAAGFGFQLSYKKIDAEGAFHYVTKYLTKEWQNQEAWALRKDCRCRIISFSRGLLSPAARKSAWETVLRGSDFETCIDHIRVDYEWHTTKRAEVTYENRDDVHYECTVFWTNVPLDNGKTLADAWEPDDWIPK